MNRWNDLIFRLFLISFYIIMVFCIPVSADDDLGQNDSAGQGLDLPDDSYDSYFTLYQPYLSNISAYQPMYFLVGADPENSMFQFSFKYRLFNRKGPLTDNNPWLTHLYFAYTQTSFWDLKSQSMPFEDSSYKPEIFFMSSSFRNSDSPFAGLFLQCGAQHESNGQSGEISRGTNYVYVTPIMIFYQKRTGWGLQVAPKIWAYFMNEDETNPDLDDYRGYVDLQIKFGKADNLVMDNHIWVAREGVSYQADLTYPLNRHFPTHLDICLQLQYSNRLAERLRYYTERTNVFRLGFCIIR